LTRAAAPATVTVRPVRDASLDPRTRLMRAPRPLHGLGLAAAVSAACLLGLLHLWLLGIRLAAGDFADPAVALRWGAAAALVATLAALRRRGVPLLWGRQALALWVLVLLLHWNAAGPRFEAGAPHASDAAAPLVVLLPSAGGVGSLLLGALVLALAAHGSATPGPRRLPGLTSAWRVRRLGPAGLPTPLAPRPPPALA